MTNEKSKENLLTILVSLFNSFIVIPISLGILLKTCWHWFITPLGIKDIGIFQSLGIVLLVNLLKNTIEDKEAYKEASLSLKSFMFFLYIIFSYLTGLLEHHLMIKFG